MICVAEPQAEDMIDPALIDRLSQIQTRQNAPNEEVQRYFSAVRRYLLGMFKDEDIANEMLQEFSIRFARGDFHKRTLEPGRFRHYLKTCLRHMVHDYWRSRRKEDAHRVGMTPEELADVRGKEAEASFDVSWRDELLKRAWAALQNDQAESSQPHFDVLLIRTQSPEARTQALLETLSQKLGKPLSVANARQLVHRARVRFAELLLQEVIASMTEPTAEELEQELIDLGILSYCQHAWEQQHEQGS
jgi:RNA polymerase sigma-70 factor (ECF subfamily)